MIMTSSTIAKGGTLTSPLNVYMGQFSQDGNLVLRMSLNWYRKCHSCDLNFGPRIKLRGPLGLSHVVDSR